MSSSARFVRFVGITTRPKIFNNRRQDGMAVVGQGIYGLVCTPEDSFISEQHGDKKPSVLYKHYLIGRTSHFLQIVRFVKKDSLALHLKRWNSEKSLGFQEKEA